MTSSRSGVWFASGAVVVCSFVFMVFPFKKRGFVFRSLGTDRKKRPAPTVDSCGAGLFLKG
jgi:hypothetical protein